MRVNWNYIKFALLLILIIGLYSYSGVKNNERQIGGIQIRFQGPAE